MNREILYRAKSAYSSKWLYGYIIKERNEEDEMYYLYRYIDELEYTDTECVDQSTIGQYIGRKDKHGNKIFEGDILEYEFEDIGKQKAIVGWNPQCVAFVLLPLGNFQFTEISNGVVVGNVYDNPEIVGGHQ